MPQPPVKTRPVRRALPRIDRAMGQQLAKLATKTGAMDPALIASWADIVGPELAKLSRPVKLSRRGKAMTLTLSVRSGAAAMRVQYAQTQILQQVASFLRQPALKRLLIEQRGQSPNSGDKSAALPVKTSRWASRAVTAQTVVMADVINDLPPLPPAKTVDEALRRLKRSLQRKQT